MYLIVLSNVVAADTLLGNGGGSRTAIAHPLQYYTIYVIIYYKLSKFVQPVKV